MKKQQVRNDILNARSYWKDKCDEIFTMLNDHIELGKRLHLDKYQSLVIAYNNNQTK